MAMTRDSSSGGLASWRWVRAQMLNTTTLGGRGRRTRLDRAVAPVNRWASRLFLREARRPLGDHRAGWWVPQGAARRRFRMTGCARPLTGKVALVTGGETLHPLGPRQTARAVAACEGFIAAYRSAIEFSA